MAERESADRGRSAGGRGRRGEEKISSQWMRENQQTGDVQQAGEAGGGGEDQQSVAERESADRGRSAGGRGRRGEEKISSQWMRENQQTGDVQQAGEAGGGGEDQQSVAERESADRGRSAGGRGRRGRRRSAVSG